MKRIRSNGLNWHARPVSRHFTFDYEERTLLRDGTPIVVRLLRPDDREVLKQGFERLSAESRYTRFFAAKLTLTDDELRYLCEIDQVSHFAIGALHASPANGKPAGLGVARFIALADKPGYAEAAITVADEVQGRGLGRLLLLRLCAAARERGITNFQCEVLGTNASMRHLLDAIAPDRQITVAQGVLTFDLVVPDVAPTETIAGPPPQNAMYLLLRAAAQNTVDWTDAIRKLWGRGRTSRE